MNVLSVKHNSLLVLGSFKKGYVYSHGCAGQVQPDRSMSPVALHETIWMPEVEGFVLSLRANRLQR